MMTTVQAAKILGVHPATMVNWRWAGRGPGYTRKGKRVYYSNRSVQRFKRGRVSHES